MNISVIGAGYLGLPVGMAFAMNGHNVTFIDKNKERVESIQRFESFCREKGIQEQMDIPAIQNRIKATTSLENALSDSQLSFVVVDTPSDSSGLLELSNLKNVCEYTGKHLANRNDYFTLAIKSTILPGTTNRELVPILEESSLKKAGRDFGVVHNPSFTNEGQALQDTLSPKPVIIGSTDKRAEDTMLEAYQGFKGYKILTDPLHAEFAKFYINNLEATAISYSNAMATLARKLGMRSDTTVEFLLKAFGEILPLRPGIGFGGPCLPKDTRALQALYRELGLTNPVLDGVIETNQGLAREFVDYCEQHRIDKEVSVLGISFKENIDDPRESRTIDIVSEFGSRGYNLMLYDPYKRAMDSMKSQFPNLKYASDLSEALNFSNSIAILTSHNEFRNPELYKGKKVFDGRCTLEKELADYHKF